MSVFQRTLEVRTLGRGFVDVTREIAQAVADARLSVGICSVFLQHTSASLAIQENADPAVLRDFERWLAKLAPEGAGYEHDDEGPDDMPAHLRTALTKTSETIPICRGALALGRWQAVYLLEHRRAPHTRTLVVTIVGE